MIVQDALNLKDEFLRKSIHIITSIIPLTYFWGLEKRLVLVISIILSVGFLTVDILRMNFDLARKYFLLIFSKLLRENEVKRRLTGATYLFIGMTGTFLLFNKEVAVPAVLLLTLADPAAAIVGKYFGKEPLLGSKTWQGSLAFLGTGILIVVFFSKYAFVGFSIVLATTILELLPLPVNDNILIPAFAGILFYTFG